MRAGGVSWQCERYGPPASLSSDVRRYDKSLRAFYRRLRGRCAPSLPASAPSTAADDNPQGGPDAFLNGPRGLRLRLRSHRSWTLLRWTVPLAGLWTPHRFLVGAALTKEVGVSR